MKLTYVGQNTHGEVWVSEEDIVSVHAIVSNQTVITFRYGGERCVIDRIGSVMAKLGAK